MTATEALAMLTSDTGMRTEHGSLIAVPRRGDTGIVKLAIYPGGALELTPGEAIGIGKALEVLGKRASGEKVIP